MKPKQICSSKYRLLIPIPGFQRLGCFTAKSLRHSYTHKAPHSKSLSPAIIMRGIALNLRLSKRDGHHAGGEIGGKAPMKSPGEPTSESGSVLCLQRQLEKAQDELATFRQFLKCIENVGMELESTLRFTEHNAKNMTWRLEEGESASLILNNLRAISAKIKPFQERLVSAESERRDLRNQIVQLEKDHRTKMNKMKQEIRRATDDIWLKENE